MTSILTNNSAMNALATLKNINNNLNTTQDRISTGLKVSSGKDNAAYFSISSTMKGDSGMYKSIDESLTLTKNAVSTGRLGVETVADLGREIAERVSFATGTGVDRAKVQEEINALTARMTTALEQSTFNGSSMVDGDEPVALFTGQTPTAVPDSENSRQVVTGVKRDAAGALSVTEITVEKVNLEGIIAAFKSIDVNDLKQDNRTAALDTASTTFAADVAESLGRAVQDAGSALTLAVNAATSLGIAEKSIETQQSFLGELSKRLDSGIGSMIDADMESEAARLQALQVQQQLATQALSIANQGPQNILSLFR